MFRLIINLTVKITPILMCWLIFFDINIASASPILQFYDQLSTVSLGASSNHDIVFVTPSGIDSSTDNINISFGTSTGALYFDLAAIAVSDIAFVVDDDAVCDGPWTPKSLASTAQNNIWGVSINNLSHGIDFQPPTNSVPGEVGAGVCLRIQIGTQVLGGIGQVVNPSIFDGVELSVSGGFGDTGRLSVLIMDNNSVNLGADVTLDSFNVGTSSTTTLPISTSTPPSGGNPPADTHAPDVLAFRLDDLTSHSVEISWITNEPVLCQLKYGKTLGYEISNSFTSSYSTKCEVELDNLEAGTKYYFRAISMDRAGNQTVTDSNFTTRVIRQGGGHADLSIVPAVSNLILTPSYKTINLKWLNAATGTSFVEIYRSDKFYAQGSADGVLLSRVPVVSRQGEFTDEYLLKSNTTYYYTLISIDDRNSRSSGVIGSTRLLGSVPPKVVDTSIKASSTPSNPRPGTVNNNDPEKIASFSLNNLDIIQDGVKINPEDGNVYYLKVDKPISLLIDGAKIPKKVASILVTIDGPAKKQQVIMTYNKPDNYYFGNLGPLPEGEYSFSVDSFDINNIPIHKLKAQIITLKGFRDFVVTTSVAASGNISVIYFVIIIILILSGFLFYLFRKKRRK